MHAERERERETLSRECHLTQSPKTEVRPGRRVGAGGSCTSVVPVVERQTRHVFPCLSLCFKCSKRHDIAIVSVSKSYGSFLQLQPALCRPVFSFLSCNDATAPGKKS